MDDDVRKDELPPPAPPQDKTRNKFLPPLWLSVSGRGVAEIRHPMGWSTWKARSQRSSLAEDPATAERFTPTPTEREGESTKKYSPFYTHSHSYTYKFVLLRASGWVHRSSLNKAGSLGKLFCWRNFDVPSLKRWYGVFFPSSYTEKETERESLSFLLIF